MLLTKLEVVSNCRFVLIEEIAYRSLKTLFGGYQKGFYILFLKPRQSDLPFLDTQPVPGIWYLLNQGSPTSTPRTIPDCVRPVKNWVRGMLASCSTPTPLPAPTQSTAEGEQWEACLLPKLRLLSPTDENTSCWCQKCWGLLF